MIEQVPIKIVLIVLLIVALRFLLTQRSLVSTSRILAMVMFGLLILLVLFPKITTAAADKLGVGRGVDLVFYLSHGFLLLLIIGLWRRTVALKIEVTKLARAMAFQNAVEPRDKSFACDSPAGSSN